MKKIGVMIILFLLGVSLISFISAPDPELSGIEQQKKDIEDTMAAVPVGPDGKFDASKLDKPKSLAEARIDGINIWLGENVAWLKFVFGMAPEISWLFVYDLFFLLYALVFFALNGNLLFVWTRKYWDNKWAPQLIGLVVFLLLLFSGPLVRLFGVEFLGVFVAFGYTFESLSKWVGDFLTSHVGETIGWLGSAIVWVVSIVLIVALVAIQNVWIKWRKGKVPAADEERGRRAATRVQKTAEKAEATSEAIEKGAAEGLESIE